MYYFFVVEKSEMITVKVTPTIYAQFQAACQMRAIKMATQLHIFMVKMIFEEQTRDPGTFGLTFSKTFNRLEEKRMKKIGPAGDDNDD
jgi:hypothetical protein